MNERPILFSGPMVRAILDGRKTQTRRVVRPQTDPLEMAMIADSITYWSLNYMRKRPYGKRGDLLWVRETWAPTPGDWAVYPCPAIWRAGFEHGPPPTNRPFRWRPSIHMPKKFCRLWLRVKDVRVERLQEITIEAAQAEGVEPDGEEGDSRRWRGGFRDLWDSINLKRGLGWASDPWVWVVEFEVATKPDGAA